MTSPGGGGGGGVYDVLYMGSAALPARSPLQISLLLGVLQRPLLDLYASAYLPKSRSAAPRALPRRRLTLTERGVIISVVDTARAPASAAPAADVDAFYAMPAVVFCDAVRSLLADVDSVRRLY